MPLAWLTREATRASRLEPRPRHAVHCNIAASMPKESWQRGANGWDTFLLLYARGFIYYYTSIPGLRCPPPRVCLACLQLCLQRRAHHELPYYYQIHIKGCVTHLDQRLSLRKKYYMGLSWNCTWLQSVASFLVFFYFSRFLLLHTQAKGSHMIVEMPFFVKVTRTLLAEAGTIRSAAAAAGELERKSN